jgi:hypothetical protein
MGSFTLDDKDDLLEIAELGAQTVLNRLGIARDSISQREAYAMFGEARVNGWIKRSLIECKRTGSSINSKKTYSLIELRLIDKLETSRRIR